MFAFLKTQLMVDDDPLQTSATAGAWLRGLPAQDITGRQRQVLAELGEVRRMGSHIDCDRMAAIAFIDDAIAADRRQLIAQYAASVDRGAALAERIWQLLDQMNQAFTATYQIALDAALARPRSASHRSLIPPLLGRLIRCFGMDGKLRAFRYQRWIPAKWRELHQLYRLAQERGIERLALPQTGSQPGAGCRMIEHEYLCVLLDHRIHTGNLSPPELDTMSERLREWSRDLALDTLPRTATGSFVVDIEGKTGLVRSTGGESGAMLRFVDTTPLVARFQQEIVTLNGPRLAGRDVEERERQCRIAILQKTWPAIAGNVDVELRRHRRESAATQVTVCVGIANIYDGLTAEFEDARLSSVLAKHYRNHTLGVIGPPRQLDTRQRSAPTVARLAPNKVSRPPHWNGHATPSTASAPLSWTVLDRSDNGLRLRAPAGFGQGLTVGTLVAVRALPTGAYMLGAVRRVCRLSSEVIEVGVSIFADRVVAATLHSQCAARDDMHFVVDGIDVSAMGATFRGLYLPLKTQSSSSATGTLIIATSNYDTNRRVVLATDDEMHALVLREPIEQHADWTWTAVELAPRLPAAHSTLR